MAEYMTLNGVPIPCLVDGAEIETQLLLDSERAESMALIENVEAEKFSGKHKLVPQTRSLAYAFRQLINGAGHYWSFDTSVYSSGGLGPQAQNGGALASDQKWLGAQSLKFLFSDTGRNISYDALPLNVPTGWTVMVAGRESGGAVWAHWLATSVLGMGGANWYKNGVGGFGIGPYSASINTALGRVTLQGDTNTTWFDELVILPYAVPVSWIPLMYAFQNPAAGNTQWSLLRQLKLQGDVLIEGGTKIVHGRVTREAVSPMMMAGVFQPSARDLDFELVEV